MEKFENNIFVEIFDELETRFFKQVEENGKYQQYIELFQKIREENIELKKEKNYV